MLQFFPPFLKILFYVFLFYLYFSLKNVSSHLKLGGTGVVKKKTHVGPIGCGLIAEQNSH